MFFGEYLACFRQELISGGVALEECCAISASAATGDPCSWS